MSVISFADAKEIVTARLNQQLKEMPESEKRRPRYIIDFRPYSILDLLAEVERETESGKSFVMDQAKQLGYAVS